MDAGVDQTVGADSSGVGELSAKVKRFCASVSRTQFVPIV